MQTYLNIAINSNIISKSSFDDKKISISVVTYFVVHALNISVTTLLRRSEDSTRTWKMGFLFILIAIMLWSLKPVLRRSFKPFFITEAIFIILYFTSYVFGLANPEFLLSMAFDTIFICVPLAIYVYSIRDKNIFYRNLLNSSYLLIPSLAFVYYISINGYQASVMPLSYSLAIPTIFQANEAIKQKKIVNIIFAFAGFVTILLFGSRGPLLCVFTFLVLSIWKYVSVIRRKVFIILMSLIVSVFLAVYWEQIMNQLYEFIRNFGINSRTLDLLIENRLLDGSGRDTIFAYYGELISERPILGWGVYGGWIGKGSGPHNMLIEIFLAFGIIIGIILSTYIITVVLKSLYKNKGIEGELLLIFISRIVVLFIFSGNFLGNPYLFILFALYHSSNEQKQSSKKLNKLKNTYV